MSSSSSSDEVYRVKLSPLDDAHVESLTGVTMATTATPATTATTATTATAATAATTATVATTATTATTARYQCSPAMARCDGLYDPPHPL